MSTPMKILTKVPDTIDELSAQLTEINHKPVVAALSSLNVLSIDVYNWQGSLFVRRNQAGHLVYNIGKECADYKAAPMTASKLNEALEVLLDSSIYRSDVVRSDVVLGMSMVIQDFARKRL